MRRSAAAVLLLALLVASCGGGGGETPRGGSDSDDGPIKIGVVGPMTGLAAFLGKNMVEGIQLAVDDLNEQGGVTGRQVEFVVRDDEGDPSRTVTAVRELVERERISALFGPVGESSYLSISRVLLDARVPTWAIAAGPELTENLHPYVFRGFLADDIQVQAIVQFAAQRYDRVAVMHGDEADGIAFRDAVREELSRHGKQMVGAESYSLDDTDHSPMVLRLRQSNPDAVIVGAQIGLFASRTAVALRNLGVNAQFLGAAGLINYTYPDLSRDAADGTIFVSFPSWGHMPREEWPAQVRTFYERYVDRYLPEGEFSATGAYRAYSTNFLTYDTVKIWASAAEQAGSADPQTVADTLNAGFDYEAEESVIGVPWSYAADDHDGIKPDDLVFYRWDLGSGGQFTLTVLGSVQDVLSGRVEV